MIAEARFRTVPAGLLTHGQGVEARFRYFGAIVTDIVCKVRAGLFFVRSTKACGIFGFRQL